MVLWLSGAVFVCAGEVSVDRLALCGHCHAGQSRQDCQNERRRLSCCEMQLSLVQDRNCEIQIFLNYQNNKKLITFCLFTQNRKPGLTHRTRTKHSYYLWLLHFVFSWLDYLLCKSKLHKPSSVNRFMLIKWKLWWRAEGGTLINIKPEALSQKIIPAEKIYKNKWEDLDIIREPCGRFLPTDPAMHHFIPEKPQIILQINLIH